MIDPPIEGGEVVPLTEQPKPPDSADRADRPGLMAPLNTAQYLLWFIEPNVHPIARVITKTHAG